MRYLLDTNILTELRKGSRANHRVSSWYQSLPPEGMFLSVLTLGEIRRGIEKLRHKDRATATALERWLAGLITLYAERILPVDERVAQEWGRLTAPRPLPIVDGLLAATAKVHELTLATRNVRDVAGTGARLLDPFDT